MAARLESSRTLFSEYTKSTSSSPIKYFEDLINDQNSIEKALKEFYSFGKFAEETGRYVRYDYKFGRMMISFTKEDYKKKYGVIFQFDDDIRNEILQQRGISQNLIKEGVEEIKEQNNF